MDKLQLVIGGLASTPRQALTEAVDALVPRLLRAGAARLKLTLTEDPAPRRSVIPFSRRPVALLSIWTANADARPWAEAVAPLAGFSVAGYRVEESVPLAYDRTWPDGEPTPGAGLLTLFDRRPGLDDATFMHRWQTDHSALSLRIHPLWCYVRNVVRSPLLEGSPPRDAIVEEHFRRPDDLLRPHRFFGGALRMLPNMLRVWRDVRGFIDMTTIETWLVRERHIRG